MPSYSFWEKDSFLSPYDYVIIGSGITGLSAAISLKQRNSKLKIAILERGFLPSGASTKNAGFCCFGSLSELVDDLKNNTLDEVVALAEKRYKGLLMLRDRVGDKALEYHNYGSYELFTKEESAAFSECAEYISVFNKQFKTSIGSDVYSLTNPKIKEFGFQSVENLIFNRYEGQIHTGEMMKSLLGIARSKNVEIFTSTECVDFEEKNGHVLINTNQKIRFQANKMIIATNGFAKQLIQADVVPARAQVLITKPIDNLKVKGTFHYDRGYYYFRNVGNRILFGGGRNLNFKSEETVDFGLTHEIQDSLESILKSVILPDINFSIDQRWSGVMGVGKTKTPIVKWLSSRVLCGVRLGGMGVALGSLLGEELANVAEEA